MDTLTFKFEPWLVILGWLAQVTMLILGITGTVSWFVALIPSMAFGGLVFLLFTLLMIVSIFRE